MEPYILSFQQLSLQDLPRVGGKNASLGEMLSRLAGQQIPVPDGFAVTAYAFREFFLKTWQKLLKMLIQQWMPATTWRWLCVAAPRPKTFPKPALPANTIPF